MAKNSEVEYIHYVIGIVNHCLHEKDLRQVILTDVLKSDVQHDGDYPFTYQAFLSHQVES